MKLLTFGPQKPDMTPEERAARRLLILDAMSDLIDNLELRRPEIILMGSECYEMIRGYMGRHPAEGFPGAPPTQYSFRAIPVELDVDCPGIWIGDDPRDPRDHLVPVEPPEGHEYRLRAGPHIHVLQGETMGQAMLRMIQDANERAVALHEFADTLEENACTKGAARRLRAILGPIL